MGTAGSLMMPLGGGSMSFSSKGRKHTKRTKRSSSPEGPENAFVVPNASVPNVISNQVTPMRGGGRPLNQVGSYSLVASKRPPPMNVGYNDEGI